MTLPANDKMTKSQPQYYTTDPEVVPMQPGLERRYTQDGKIYHPPAPYSNPLKYYDPRTEKIPTAQKASILRSTTPWLVAAVILAISAAVAVGAALGVKYQESSQDLQTCLNQLQRFPTTTTANTSASNSTCPVATTSNCTEGQLWTSNLTGVEYVAKCNVDFATGGGDNLNLFLIVPSMDICAITCDAITYGKTANATTVALWSQDGGGDNPNQAGECFCVAAAQDYTMKSTQGIDGYVAVDSIVSTTFIS